MGAHALPAGFPERPDRLLPTILSRTQQIHVPPLRPEVTGAIRTAPRRRRHGREACTAGPASRAAT